MRKSFLMKIFIYPLLNNAGSPAHKLTHTMKTLINFKKREGENNFELFFESNDLPRVQYFLETKQFDDLMRLSHKEKDETDIQLRLELSRGGKRFTAQLFEYFSTTYEAISPLMEFSTKEALSACGGINALRA